MTTPCQHATTAAAFIRDRAIMGREKYGVTLSDANLSPAELVQHAREEAADFLVYLTALQASMARLAVTWQPIETAPKERIYDVVQYVMICARYPDTNIQTDCVYSWWDGAGWARWHHTFPPSLWMAVPALPSQSEPARPAVTWEAVMRIVTDSAYTDCSANAGDCCAPDRCPCGRTIDAIMALIGGEA